MSYKINGVDLDPLPSVAKWGARRALGVDGNNNIIYSGVSSFQMQWDALSTADFATLYAKYTAAATAGSASVDLPVWPGQGDYEFTTYTGCVLDEPTVGEFLAGFYLKVTLTVRNIVI